MFRLEKPLELSPVVTPEIEQSYMGECNVDIWIEGE